MKNNQKQIIMIFFILKVSLISVQSIKTELVPFNGIEPITKYIDHSQEVIFFNLPSILMDKAPNYLKIVVEGRDDKNINYVLSAYKPNDINFSDRFQMSQSKNKNTYMWLSYEQIINGEFISVECSEIPCSYDITFSAEAIIELNFSDQYVYYVTESNKIMTFSFLSNEYKKKEIDQLHQESEADSESEESETDNEDYSYLTIWAKGGGREIETSIKRKDEFIYETNKNQNIYILKFNQTNEYNNFYPLSLTVTATPGDLIKVGSTFIKSNGIVTKTIKSNEEGAIGLLKKNFLEEICYKIEMTTFTPDTFLFLPVNVYNRIISSFTKTLDGERIPDSITISNYESLVIELNSDEINEHLYCFGFPKESENDDQFIYDLDEIEFSFQLINPNIPVGGGLNFISPLMGGHLYQWYIKSGEQFGFIGMKPQNDYHEINYNLLSIIGEIKMSLYKCDNYPLCIDEKIINIDDKDKIINAHSANKISTWSVYKEDLDYEVNPINKNQNILIAKCINDTKTVEIIPNMCGMGLMIYSNKDLIDLVENIYFSQLLLTGEKDSFRINYFGEDNIEKIYVDITVFSGEVTVEVDSLDKKDENISHEYYSANKIFLSINLLKLDSDISKEFLFSIKGNKNSYYTLQFSLMRTNDEVSKFMNEIPSGMSYLITIDPLMKVSTGDYPNLKFAKFENIRIPDHLPYFANFLSLNCKLKVDNIRKTKKMVYNNETEEEEEEEEYIYTPVETVDYYSQDIITSNDINKYYSLEYLYRLNIEESDYGIYSNKFCMVYASGIEIEEGENGIIRPVLVGDNIAQQIFFKKGLRNFKYLYPLVENQFDISIRLNLIDKAEYVIKKFFEYSKSPDEIIVSTNTIIYIDHSEWKGICKDKNEVCNIIIDITLLKEIEDDEPMLEMAIKTLNYTTPTYLQKSVMKHDYLHGEEPQYFYTDLGINESGYVVLNVHRGSGKIFGRLVPKKLDTPEKNAVWRGMYRFPRGGEDEELKNIEGGDLVYDEFYKKIFFDTGKENSPCKDGCFLLLTVESSVEGFINHHLLSHSFTLIVNSAPFSGEYHPIISISTEEYVIGNIGISENGENNLKEVYSVWLPHNSDKVVIDLQSKEISIFINIGQDQVPLFNKYDFKFITQGENSLITLSRQEIVDKLKKKGLTPPYGENNIKDLYLNIGMWTNITDINDTMVYAFKVHLGTLPNLDIYRIKSDQITLCEATKYENYDSKYPYRCLFIIEYQYFDAINNLLLYPILKDPSAFYQIYGEYLDKDDYETLDQEEILLKMPNKDSTFSTSRTNHNYLYLPHGEINDYLLVSIVTNKLTTIQLMSTFNTFDEELTPNPSTPQLFTLKTKELKMNFLLENDPFIVNIASIDGRAQVYWESDPKSIYFIRGRDDRLSITSTKNVKNDVLIVNNLDPISVDDIGKEDDTNPGFAFYITYNLRSEENNLDELILGKSTNFVYTQSDLPISHYTKISDYDKKINIFFTFYSLENSLKNADTFYEEKPFNIYAGIVKESTVYNIRKNPGISFDITKSIQGKYDNSLQTGYVSLSKEDIRKYNIEKYENPFLYLLITKNEDNEKLFEYSKISYEVTVTQENSQIPSTEKIYQHGNLAINTDYCVYKLKTSLIKKYMRIEFATNSGFLNWSISNKSGNKNNQTFSEMSSKFINGRSILTFDSNPQENEVVYLTIFHSNKNKASSSKLTNFVFKYINTKDINNLKDYLVINSNLEVDIKENKDDTNNYTVIFDPIPNSNENSNSSDLNEKLNVTYLLKFVEKKNLISSESFETIALTETICLVKEFVNPISNTEKMTLEIFNVKKKFKYIQVIALINDYTINEFVAYKPFTTNISTDEEDNENNESDRLKKAKLIILICLGIVLVIIVTVLIIVVFRFRKKNKDLLAKVEKVSFQQEEQERTGSNDGGLLLDEDKNALN